MYSHRWLFPVLLLALPGGAAPAGTGEPAAKRPPNILFLLTDDQRPDTIGALGNPAIETPALDALTRRGLSFTRAVCGSPLCVPSRAEILTGTSGFRNGILPGFSSRLRPGLAYWPQVLRQAGYHTWYVGKWHTPGRPSTLGYEESLGLYGSGKGDAPPRVDHLGRPITGYRGWVFQTDDRKLFPEKGVGLTPNISALFADAAIVFLERKAKEPFFLHVNFTAPHDPLLPPPGYEKKYDPAKVPLPGNFLPRHPFDHGNLMGRDEVLLPFPRTPEMVRAELALYYSVISHLDQQVGRILRALEATGQADDTLVIFASDHGLAIGSHGLRGKQNMYEHTVNVPLVLAGPGVPKGRRCAAQVYLRDLFPTTCELAGVKVPASVDGRSLVPLLADPGQEVRDAVYCYFTGTQRMVRTDHWKLIHYPEARRWQLFDLRADPLEKHDLSGDPGHGEVLARLRQKLRRWQEGMKDPVLEAKGD